MLARGKRLLVFCLLGSGVILLPVSRLNAQVLYGSLVGTVVDQSGAVIPAATVAIENPATGLARSVKTDSAGFYSISDVTAGTYNVTVSKQGFRVFTRTGVAVAINTVARIDVTLQVGETSQHITVESTVPLLQTDRSDVRHELTATEIENVPMPPGRNFEQLFRVIPGVNPPVNAHSIPSNPSRALQFNVNGTSSYGNDVRIDGVSQFNIWLPENAAYIPSADAIQTVNVVTGDFSPEQGLAGGSSINVEIKSGTNQVHGDVYEFHNDSALESRPFFIPGQVPKDVFNQFGGSIGGPIKRDKLFYFVNDEVTRERQFASRFATVPTAAMRNGDLTATKTPIYDPATGNPDGSGRAILKCSGVANMICGNRISPVAAKLLALLPTPNINTSIINDNYLGATDFAFNRNTLDSKINWNATDKFTMYGHLGLLNYTMLDPQTFGKVGGPEISGFGGNPGKGNGHTTSLSATGNYVFSPNFVVDASFGLTRMVTNSQQLDLSTKPGTDILGIPGTNGTRRFEGSWPQFNISNFTVLGTPDSFMPYFRNDPQFFWSGNASWIKGRHSVRFGGDVFTLHLNQQQPEFNAGSSYGPQGGFAFGAGPTTLNTNGKASKSSEFNDIVTFLLGLDTNYGKNIQVPDFFHTLTNQYALYVGDQWQATPKLTATLGLRWEYFPMPNRGGGRGMERYDFAKNEMMICGVGGVPTDCGVSVSAKAFAPRVGLAYRATSSFVVRAGYGITNEPYNLADDLRTNYPVLIPLFVNAPTSFLAAGVLDSASLQNAPPGSNLPVGIPLPGPPDLTGGEIPIPGNVGLGTTGSQVQRGYIQSWNLTLEKELGSGWVAQAGYVATRSIHQIGFLDLNVGDPTVCFTKKGKTSCGGTASEPYKILFGRTASTSLITPIANNHYDALQSTLQHRFARSYEVKFAYTWSKAIGMAGVENEKNNPSIQTPKFYYLNRGLAPIDRPHNFEALFIAESPFGAGRRWANTGGLASALLGGWQANGIFTAVSGRVFSVTSSGTSLNAPGNSQRADLIKSHVGTFDQVGRGTTWFDTSAFAPVTDQRFGTAAFNLLHGPSLFNLDFGLFRNFRLSERWNLQFRAQAFNSTNTPHFSNPNGNANSSAFGSVTSTTNLAREGVDPREFQFALRLSF